jgi:large subunit ribosomal protein L6
MSRIGKLPIAVPQGVDINIANGVVTVKGKLGELVQEFDTELIEITQEENTLTVNRKNDSKPARSKHGLYRALVANMVKGVSEGFKTVQELHGVGFRASNNGQVLELSLGFSHDIYIELPAEVKIETESAKGKAPKVTLTCADKQLLGQVAAKIRSLRKPEPYKGKGIRFEGEEIRRKDGKTATA